MPSLLATVDAKLEVGDKFLNSSIEYLQYFASGRAATALAMRKGVREAMLRRLDPEGSKAMGQGARSFNADPDAVSLRRRIDDWLGDPDDPARDAREDQLIQWTKDKYGSQTDIVTWINTCEVENLQAALDALQIP